MTTTATRAELVHEMAGATITLRSPSTMRRDDWAAQRRQLDGIANGGLIHDHTGATHTYVDAAQAAPIWSMLLVSIDLNGEKFRTLEDLRTVAMGARRTIHEEIDPARKGFAMQALNAFGTRVAAAWLLTQFDKNMAHEEVS